MHCDIWTGFVFVNFDDEPRQTLREFLGPMVTGLDDYPFDKLTERYDWVAAQQQQLEDLRRRLPGVLPRAVAAPPAGTRGGA